MRVVNIFEIFTLKKLIVEGELWVGIGGNYFIGEMNCTLNTGIQFQSKKENST